MTTNIVTATEEPKRSDAYIKLLGELKQSFVKAEEMVLILYEQGKKDGLPNHVIRKDIEIALDGIVKERRLRELLPLELKRSYTISTDNNDDSATIAESSTSDLEELKIITAEMKSTRAMLEADRHSLDLLKRQIEAERNGEKWTYEDHKRIAIAAWNGMPREEAALKLMQILKQTGDNIVKRLQKEESCRKSIQKKKEEET